jgi:signal transduction histidine kinase
MSTSHTTSRLALGEGDRASAASPTPVTSARTARDDARSGGRRRYERRSADRRGPGDAGGATAALVAAETRRLAAEVHDLIMQDLSWALANARALQDDPAVASRASTVVNAAERALAGAREVLGGLSDRDRKTVVEAVEDSVRTAARGTPFMFDSTKVPPGVQPDQPTLDALVHISREAVTNAVKHGGAASVAVVLWYSEGWRLKVGDRGCGFDQGSRRAGGFGLDSMSSQARALGGKVRVTSVPGEGTIVEAILP